MIHDYTGDEAWIMLIAERSNALAEIYNKIAIMPRLTNVARVTYGDQVYAVYDGYAEELSKWRLDTAIELGAHYDNHRKNTTEAANSESRKDFINEDMQTLHKYAFQKLIKESPEIFNENLAIVEQRPVMLERQKLEHIVKGDGKGYVKS